MENFDKKMLTEKIDDIMLTDILEDLEIIKLEFERKEVLDDLILMVRGLTYGVLFFTIVLIFIYIPRAILEVTGL